MTRELELELELLKQKVKTLELEIELMKVQKPIDTTLTPWPLSEIVIGPGIYGDSGKVEIYTQPIGTILDTTDSTISTIVPGTILHN